MTQSLIETEKGTSLWQDAWLRLRKNKASIVSVWLLLLIAIVCLFGPLFPFVDNPNLQDLPGRNAAPSGEHWFGTDHLGRDLFSRVLYGGRISILVALVTAAVSVTIGLIWGSIAGYAKGRVDTFMMRTVDILYALPFLVIVILLRISFEPMTEKLTAFIINITGEGSRESIEPITTLIPLFLAIGALSWLSLSRIIRASVQNIASQEYIEAARSLGIGNVRILLKHIFPNILGPVIVYTTLTIPSIMLFEAMLSFLGLGVKAPNASWGVLIEEGANRMFSNPQLLIFPSVFFVITLLALNFLGDGLRDALDPRASKD
jgi:oligopeptide transport system permease protein